MSTDGQIKGKASGEHLPPFLSNELGMLPEAVISVPGLGVVRDFQHVPGLVHVPPQQNDVVIFHVSGGRSISRRLGRKSEEGSRLGSFAHIAAGTDPIFDVRSRCRVLHFEIENKKLPGDGFFDQRVDHLQPVSSALANWISSGRRSLSIRTLAASLICEMNGLLGKPTPKQGGLNPALCTRLDNWIERRLTGQLSESDLADFSGLSPGHFRRAFKQSFGTSAMRYVKSRRAALARDLLDSGEDPGKTAEACGLPSIRALRDLLRKHT